MKKFRYNGPREIWAEDIRAAEEIFLSGVEEDESEITQEEKKYFREDEHYGNTKEWL